MDRREMVRQYKETPRPAGVFIVRHAPTGRALLGTSPDAPAMLNRVRAQLRMKGHPNRELQHDWDSGQPADFHFEVLDVVDQAGRSDLDLPSELDELESLWRQELALTPDTSY